MVTQMGDHSDGHTNGFDTHGHTTGHQSDGHTNGLTFSLSQQLGHYLECHKPGTPIIWSNNWNTTHIVTQMELHSDGKTNGTQLRCSHKCDTTDIVTQLDTIHMATHMGHHSDGHKLR